jgi:hypothetical protein
MPTPSFESTQGLEEILLSATQSAGKFHSHSSRFVSHEKSNELLNLKFCPELALLQSEANPITDFNTLFDSHGSDVVKSAAMLTFETSFGATQHERHLQLREYQRGAFLGYLNLSLCTSNFVYRKFNARETDRQAVNDLIISFVAKGLRAEEEPIIVAIKRSDLPSAQVLSERANEAKKWDNGRAEVFVVAGQHRITASLCLHAMIKTQDGQLSDKPEYAKLLASPERRQRFLQDLGYWVAAVYDYGKLVDGFQVHS